VLIEPLELPPDAIVSLPGSKSVTNRCLVAAALGAGVSTLSGVLLADDTWAMLDGLRALGVQIAIDSAHLEVRVAGTQGVLRPCKELDARCSGTTARFLVCLMALSPVASRMNGSGQLRRRPMAPILDALRSLGASVCDAEAPGHLPVVVTGPTRGGEVDIDGAISSQFLSGLLLTGAYMPSGLRIRLRGELVSRPYVAMTAAVMERFGVPLDLSDGVFSVSPGCYHAVTETIEPDASAASYLFAAAAITAGRIKIPGLGAASVQGDVRFVDVLERMGAAVHRGSHEIEVTGTGVLHGIDVDLSDFSDTAPTLAVVAAFADSPTRVTGIGFIRRKESDRIAAIVTELRRCGIDAQPEPDGFTVRPGTPHAAVIRTYADHRIAMSFALLGLRSHGIEIADPDCVAKTFPDYFSVINALQR